MDDRNRDVSPASLRSCAPLRRRPDSRSRRYPRNEDNEVTRLAASYSGWSPVASGTDKLPCRGGVGDRVCIRIGRMRLKKAQRAAAAQERAFTPDDARSDRCQELNLHLQRSPRPGHVMKQVPHGDVHRGRQYSSVKRALGIEQRSHRLEFHDATLPFILDAEAEQPRKKKGAELLSRIGQCAIKQRSRGSDVDEAAFFIHQAPPAAVLSIGIAMTR
jgi:hypothetical protein